MALFPSDIGYSAIASGDILETFPRSNNCDITFEKRMITDIIITRTQNHWITSLPLG